MTRRTVGMSRAAWEALPSDTKRVRGRTRFVVDPDTGGAAVRVQLHDETPPLHRPTVAEVAALLSALTRELS